jgi:DNA polymerase-3 subunit epsilon
VLNEQEVPIVNFGKYKGEPVVDVLRKNPGYLSWIMQGDFPQNTKQAFMRIKLQMQG